MTVKHLRLNISTSHKGYPNKSHLFISTAFVVIPSFVLNLVCLLCLLINPYRYTTLLRLPNNQLLSLLIFSTICLFSILFISITIFITSFGIFSLILYCYALLTSKTECLVNYEFFLFSDINI